MNEVLDYFKSLDSNPFYKNKVKLIPSKEEIRIISSITPYLFEDLDIDLINGDYVLVSESISDVDADYIIKDGKVNKVNNHIYETGNCFINSGLKVDELVNGIITIEDGIYLIDGKKTCVSVPFIKNDEYCNNDSLNKEGFSVTVFGDDVYLSKTFYDKKSKMICNEGYNSAVKIKIVFDMNTNFFYQMQLAAKLALKLVNFNGLSCDDVKSNLFFNGLVDPVNLHKNDLWYYFKALVQVEDDITYYKSLGYEVELETSNKYINKNGTIDKTPPVKGLDYTIKTYINGIDDSLSFLKLI